MKHYLKTWKMYFDQIVNGTKNFEIRKNDRNFKTGDVLVLQEWDKSLKGYTGKEVEKEIVYILENSELFGLQKGFVIMGFKNELIETNEKLIRQIDFLENEVIVCDCNDINDLNENELIEEIRQRFGLPGKLSLFDVDKVKELIKIL
jgi:Domain of unknown function (DUF3850)